MPYQIDLEYIKHKIVEKRYLFLDLDETLIYSSRDKIHLDSIKLKSPNKGYINLRPFVHQFLEEVSKIFNLILYTAGEAFYAEQIL